MHLLYTSPYRTLTLSKWVLFNVLSADGNVFEEALSGMSAALLHWVLGTQGKNSQVLEGQQQFDKSQVQLLSKDLTNLITLILYVGEVDRNVALAISKIKHLQYSGLQIKQKSHQ